MRYDQSIISQMIAGNALTNASLRGADFSEQFLFGANFTGSDLQNASFRKANVSHARFSSLHFVDMANANGQHASFSGWMLHHINAENANLDHADFTRTHMTDMRMKGASLSHANLAQAQLTHVDLRDADLSGANLDGIRWDGTTSLAHIKGLDTALNVPKGFIEAVATQTESSRLLEQQQGVQGWLARRSHRVNHLVSGVPRLA